MAEQDENETTPGSSRRDVFKKGAAIGGVIWAVPMIESFTNKASAQTLGSPLQPPGTGNISYVALTISCAGVCTQVKIEAEKATTPECGGSVNTPCCSLMAACPAGTSTTCPTGLVTGGNSGGISVQLPLGCVLVDYRVHCGQCCEGPGRVSQPAVGASGTLHFVPCFGVGNTNKPCASDGNKTVACNEKHVAALHVEPLVP